MSTQNPMDLLTPEQRDTALAEEALARERMKAPPTYDPNVPPADPTPKAE